MILLSKNQSKYSLFLFKSSLSIFCVGLTQQLKITITYENKQMRVFNTTEIEENKINNTNIIINDYNQHTNQLQNSKYSSINNKNISSLIGSVKNIPSSTMKSF